MKLHSNMLPFVLAIVSACSVLISGCGLQNVGGATCSSQDSVNTAVDLIKQQIEKDASNKAKKNDGTFAVSLSSIRATISQLKIIIEDIRTTKSDPNSARKFCASTTKVTFPLKLLADAEDARNSQGQNNIGQLADTMNAHREADAIKFDMDYSVTPTDDKSKVYVESDSMSSQMDLLSEIVVWGLMKPAIESQKAAQQLQEQQQQIAQNQAVQASRNQEILNNKLSIQAIAASWSAIDSNTKVQILPQQRAWVASKDAECKVQAASSSTDPTEQEAARLKCDTAANLARVEWLRQYLPH